MLNLKDFTLKEDILNGSDIVSFRSPSEIVTKDGTIYQMSQGAANWIFKHMGMSNQKFASSLQENFSEKWNDLAKLKFDLFYDEWIRHITLYAVDGMVYTGQDVPANLLMTPVFNRMNELSKECTIGYVASDTFFTFFLQKDTEDNKCPMLVVCIDFFEMTMEIYRAVYLKDQELIIPISFKPVKKDLKESTIRDTEFIMYLSDIEVSDGDDVLKMLDKPISVQEWGEWFRPYGLKISSLYDEESQGSHLDDLRKAISNIEGLNEDNLQDIPYLQKCMTLLPMRFDKILRAYSKSLLDCTNKKIYYSSLVELINYVNGFNSHYDQLKWTLESGYVIS